MSYFMCCRFEGPPIGRYHCSFVLDFGSDVRVCLEGIRLVDPPVCFLRGPKVYHARVGAWLAKEELAAGLFVTSKLWR